MGTTRKILSISELLEWTSKGALHFDYRSCGVTTQNTFDVLERFKYSNTFDVAKVSKHGVINPADNVLLCTLLNLLERTITERTKILWDLVQYSNNFYVMIEYDGIYNLPN